MTLELILRLLQLRFKLYDSDSFDTLRSLFAPDATTILDLDASENCWEDVTNASLSYLLKTSLGKGAAKSAATNVQTNTQIKQLVDVEKLKQNITLVCDKISKGAKIEF